MRKVIRHRKRERKKEKNNNEFSGKGVQHGLLDEDVVQGSLLLGDGQERGNLKDGYRCLGVKSGCWVHYKHGGGV